MTDTECPECTGERTVTTYPMDIANRRYPHNCLDCGHRWTVDRGEEA